MTEEQAAQLITSVQRLAQVIAAVGTALVTCLSADRNPGPGSPRPAATVSRTLSTDLKRIWSQE